MARNLKLGRGYTHPWHYQHGYLLRNGEFTVLNFPESPATDPFCINDDGVIVGRYTDRNGNTHGFKAAPRN